MHKRCEPTHPPPLGKALAAPAAAPWLERGCRSARLPRFYQHTGGEGARSQKYPCGEQRQPPGLASSLPHVARLDCSAAALTQAGRTHASPASPGVCSALQALPPAHSRGCRTSGSSETIFPCILPLPLDDYRHLHGLCRCRWACCQSHSPTNRSRSVLLKKEQRWVTESGPLSPAVCATDAPCLPLRRTVTQHDSISSSATATERGCNENLHVIKDEEGRDSCSSGHS